MEITTVETLHARRIRQSDLEWDLGIHYFTSREKAYLEQMIWQDQEIWIWEIYRYKSRLIGKGCTQVEGFDYDETFPAVGNKSLLSGVDTWKRHGLGRRRRRNGVFVWHSGWISSNEKALRFDDESGRVFRLIKCVCGLRRRPRFWCRTLKTYLRNFGFKTNLKDKCLFLKDGSALFVYVKDLVISTKTVNMLNQFKANLSWEFEIKDLGWPKFIIGVQIIETSESIFLSQETNDQAIAKRFGLER